MSTVPVYVDPCLRQLCLTDDRALADLVATRLETPEAGFITSGWLAGLGALPGIAGMIITPIYSLRQRSIALLAEELKAPGREVAYIPKAKRTFG